MTFDSCTLRYISALKSTIEYLAQPWSLCSFVPRHTISCHAPPPPPPPPALTPPNAAAMPEKVVIAHRPTTPPTHHTSSNKSSKSSSSHPFLLATVTFCSESSCSATAPNNCFNCSSDTFPGSWPVFAKVIRRFSTFVARDSLTSLMRPRRSAASGVRICASSEARASAS